MLRVTQIPVDVNASRWTQQSTQLDVKLPPPLHRNTQRFRVVEAAFGRTSCDVNTNWVGTRFPVGGRSRVRLSHAHVGQSAVMSLCCHLPSYRRHGLSSLCLWDTPPSAWAFGPDPRLDPGAAKNGLNIIEDTQKDSRWRPLPGDEGSVTLGIAEEVRLYVMSPISSASGERIGTLSVWGSEPKDITGTGIDMMVKEMIEVVENHFRTAHEKWLIETQNSERHALASLDAGPEYLAIVDTEVSDWQIVHLSKAAMQLLGYVVEKKGLPFSKVFNFESSAAAEGANQSLGLVLDCEVHIVTSLHDELRRFMLFSRPASEQPIGRAWWAAHGQQKNLQPPETLKVMEVSEMTHRSSRGSLSDNFSKSHSNCSNDQAGDFETTTSLGWSARTVSAEAVSHVALSPIEGLEVGPPVGRGAYGRVYRGKYFGEPVAVKVIDSLQSVRWSDGQPLEALLPSTIDDPGIIRTIAQKVVPDEQEGGRLSVVWLIMEWCEHGDLGAGITEGLFREGGRSAHILTGIKGPTNYRLVLDTALQVANGLVAIHKRGIVHGDLAAGNVLLAAAPELPQGFRAKLGDFGLSRQLLEVRSRITTNSYGCINYLAPEVITEGRLSKAADVYAFGVLVWEMVTHNRAWAGMLHAQVMYTIAILRKTLEIPNGCHPGVSDLIQQCLNHDAASRPSAGDLVTTVQQLLIDLE
eukprot:jgi/Botrbrau1/9879/Bobra.0080s0014.1